MDPRALSSSFVLAVLLGLAPAAEGQRDGAGTAAREPTARAARLDDLARRVDEAMRAAADAAAALEALQKLQQEIAELRASQRDRAALQQGHVGVLRRLDRFERRIEDLELRLSAIAFERAGPAELNPRRGFSLSSADERYLLRLGGLIQAEYGALLYASERQYLGTGLGNDEASFSLRRARLVASGHAYSPRAQFYLAMQHGAARRADGASVEGLLDGYLDLRVHRMFRVRAGLQKNPYGRQFNLGADQTLFVDRGPATIAFYPGRDVGAVVHGELLPYASHVGQISYQLGLFNGVANVGQVDLAQGDDNVDLLYVARVQYEPLGALGVTESDRQLSERPRLALGGSFYFNRVPTDAAVRLGVFDDQQAQRLRDQDDDGQVDNVDIMGAGAELAVHFRGVSAQSELFYRRESPGGAESERSFWGAYTQLGFHHATGLDAGARYSFWQSHRYGEDQSIVHPTDSHELAGTLSWSPRCGENSPCWPLSRPPRGLARSSAGDEVSVKLQLEYGYLWLRDLRGRDTDVDDLRAHRVVLFGQIAF